MPVSYVIDKKNRVVIVTATGVMTAHDVLEFCRQVANDPEFDPSFSQLGDVSGAEVDLSADEVRLFAQSSPFALDSRRAFVGTSPVVYGLARMFEIVRGLRGDQDIRVFRGQPSPGAVSPRPPIAT